MNCSTYREVGFEDTSHTNEWCTGLVTDSLRGDPICGVRPFLSNALTWLANRHLPQIERPRFTQSNFTWQFADHDVRGVPVDRNIHTNYEGWRAPYVSRIVQEYPITLSMHGHEEIHDWVVYGPNASGLVRGIATYLGYKRAVIGNPSGMMYRHGRVLGLEMSRRKPEELVAHVRGILQELVGGLTPAPGPIDEYGPIGAVSESTVRYYGLQRAYEAFEPLPEDVMHDLGFPKGSCALGWNFDKYGSDGAAEVVAPNAPPLRHKIV